MRLVISSDVDTIDLPVRPYVSLGVTDVWCVVQGGLDGVWGGVDMRAEETDNPSGPGLLYPGVVQPGGRYLTVVFAHWATDSALAEMQARDRIAGLLGRDLTVQLDGPLGLRTVTGFIKSKPEFTHYDYETCTCGIVIVCPDPHWYGLPVSVAGEWGAGSDGGLAYPLYGGSGLLEYSGTRVANRVWVPNAGLRGSWPTLRVVGAVSWARFSCGRQVVELRQQVDDLTVESRSGTASSGGVDVTGFLTRDDFFEIPAGGAWVSFQASAPVGFSVEVAPAWL